MQSKSLRIGNLLQDSEGKICKVRALSTEEGNEIEAYGSHATAGLPLSYIPITESWLTKLGFKLEFGNTRGSFVLYDGDSIGICKTNFGYSVVAEYETLTNVKFIHQIQNIYFFLKGIELKIEENDNTKS